MGSLALMNSNSPLPPREPSKPRLLLVSDSEERMRGLRASFNAGEIEMTSARFL